MSKKDMNQSPEKFPKNSSYSKQESSRKEFLKKAAAGGAALIGGAAFITDCRRGRAPKSAQGPAVHLSKKSFSWTMVTTWPRNFPALGTGANRLARRIEEMSGGQLAIEVKAAGERVPALQVFDAVRSGTAELGHGASYYWKGKLPAAQFFSAVPFGFDAEEMAAWLRYGGAYELWKKLYSDFGLVPFACGNTGVQMGGWFNKEIHSLKDFKGLVMRMPGLGGEVIRELGAAAPNIPGGELFQSLESGVIDATEWVGPYNDLAFGLYKAAKYYYWPGWHEPGTVIELIANQAAFAGLPKHLQKIVEYACLADYNEMLAEFTARNTGALRVLINEKGVQLRKFPEDALVQLSKISKEVVAHLGNSDPAAKEIYNSFVKFQKDAAAWTRIGEGGFLKARDL